MYRILKGTVRSTQYTSLIQKGIVQCLLNCPHSKAGIFSPLVVTKKELSCNLLAKLYSVNLWISLLDIYSTVVIKLVCVGDSGGGVVRPTAYVHIPTVHCTV